MIETRYFSNRCRAEIPSGDERTNLEVASGPDRFCASWHLCGACYAGFKA